MIRLFNRYLALLGLLALAAPLFAVAKNEVDQTLPAYINETIYSPNYAAVASIVPSQSADIILLRGGLEQGLKRGMVCTVERGLRSIAEIIIIESRTDRAAALILDLSSETFIQSGDIARIKTIQIN
ncbi:MAG: hypothetical protein ACON39_09040 [Coraliomargaritaceae bacterium]